MKKIIAIQILLLVPIIGKSSQMLENSIWGSAANYAGINVDTLYSIAVQESGMKWNDGSFRPWPWTLNVNKGKKGIREGARRYSSRGEAEAALKDLIKNGVRNVDVGIMQVNLYWHGDKVPNDLALLDPRTNIHVAAKYLKDLNLDKNVTKTVGSYHSPGDLVKRKSYTDHVKHYEKIIHEKLK